MLSSIHPLGERARNNKWILTAGAFTAGSLLSGATVGLLLGTIGYLTAPASTTSLLALTAVGAVAAGALDLVGVEPPGPGRQVNENWIGAFRGWVYGGGFGFELGLGFATYMVTWGVYAYFLSALLTAAPISGALVGAVFGLGRSLSVLAAGVIDRPSRLTSFTRRLAQAGAAVRKSSALAFTLIGCLTIGMMLL